MTDITTSAVRKRAIAVCGPGLVEDPAIGQAAERVGRDVARRGLERAEDAVAAAVAAMDEWAGR